MTAAVRAAGASPGAAVVAAGGVLLLLAVAAFGVDPRLGAATLAVPVGLLVAASPAVGVALLLFALPLEELGALTPGGAVTLHKLLGLGVAGAWALGVVVRREPIRLPVALLPLGAFVLWAAASALWAFEPAASIRLSLRLVQLLALYLLVVNALDRPLALRRALLAHVAGGVALAVFGLHLVRQGVLQAGRAAIVVDRQLLLEPNALAAALLLPVAICLTGALDRARPGLERAALAAAGSLCITMIVLTLSRGAMVAVGAIGLVVAAARRQLLLPVGLGLLALPGVAAVGPDLWERLVEGVTFADRGAGRLDIWRVGWVVIQDQPVAGVGLGCFPLIYFEYLSQATGISWRHVQGVAATLERYPHSTYLGTAAELGAVGLGLLLVTLAAHLRGAVASWRALAARRHPAAGLLLAAVGGLVAMAVLGVGLDVGLRKPLWLALGLAALGRPALRRRRRGGTA